MNAIKRLEDLLNEKDRKIDELHEKLDKLEDLKSREWGWCIHSEGKNENGLPVPRLEIRAKTMSGNWGNFEWIYCLVYKHLLGHIVKVPLGKTTTQSGRELPPIFDGRIEGPFRDGAHLMHDSETLKPPAFYVVETDPPVIQKCERRHSPLTKP